MTTTGLDVFDRTVQESNLWLKSLAEKLPGADRHTAYLALRAVLHALRDRIGPDSAVHLGAQFPTLIRGIYYEGWHMHGTPTRERHIAAFLDHVGRELVNFVPSDVELAVRAVFELLWEKIDLGEVTKLIELFPAEMRNLWLVSSGATAGRAAPSTVYRPHSEAS